MRTWQEKDSNGSGGLVGFLGLVFHSPFQPATYFARISWLPIQPTVRPPRGGHRLVILEPRAGFRKPRAWVFLTCTCTHVYTPQHTLGVLIQTRCCCPLCQPCVSMAFSSVKLLVACFFPFFFPPPSTCPLYPLHVQIVSDSYWASLIFLLLLLQTLDASKAGKIKGKKEKEKKPQQPLKKTCSNQECTILHAWEAVSHLSKLSYRIQGSKFQHMKNKFIQLFFCMSFIPFQSKRLLLPQWLGFAQVAQPISQLTPWLLKTISSFSVSFLFIFSLKIVFYAKYVRLQK